MLYQFLLYCKNNQPYIDMYPLLFELSSYSGHHRALSRVPGAIQQVIINYLFYTQQCIYVNSSLPVLPTPFPPLYPHICSLHLCFYFCFVKKIIYTNFFRFHIYALIYGVCFSSCWAQRFSSRSVSVGVTVACTVSFLY